MPAAEVVLYEVSNGVGVLTLNRPHKRNAFTPTSLRLLSEALTEAEQDASVEAVVLCGSDGAFCAGADIAWELAATPDEFRGFIMQIQQLTRRLRDSRLLVVAAIEGPAVGGGAELAVASDYRVAAPDAVIGFPEVKLGLTVTGGEIGRAHV